MNVDTKRKEYFTTRLRHWHLHDNTRELPWKEEKDPYRIWLSEIIMQQTRSQQGLPYYLNFIREYPTVQDLAGAEDEAVFRLWQGLGYYNRCKNMLATARYIAHSLGGTFPATYDDLLSLKGIGPYTAAAIASFAYQLPHAVIDGNVYRVLSRYFGIETAFDTTEGKKLFHALAGELLDRSRSGLYNQAIMDHGATICTPQNPLCDTCPVQKKCIALQEGTIHLLPVRSKKQSVKNRYFHYVLLQAGEEVWVSKRTGKDIWENLHELLLLESETPLDKEQVAEWLSGMQIPSSTISYSGHIKQRLTHQLIGFRFYTVALSGKTDVPGKQGRWVPKAELARLGFPKSIVSFLEKNFYF